ncbi:MAG: 7-cyano-7-deazaguanine synthase QueC [Muribaculaceae bacterium]|nr:7-cyano-7-deazaguanine synthase QueC [Muribaculaceae bacterium]MBR1474055.1 7-cyano-7-deazaguanine synthase QueC [Muribaculaceae bacterium]MBR1725199.1 7-cyano-7-deazaguanine synthase QueC [Muribaculaceae bacterium]
MKDAVLITSGGMDSTTMLYEYKDEIALAITFDYGSTQNGRERQWAITHCQRLGIKHLIIRLDFMHRYFKSALLESAEAIPDGNYDDENMRVTVVPFRNGIMLSIACGIAESYGLKRVMIANHAGDHSIYPDCRGSFVEAMSAAMQQGTYEGVRVYAPYTHLSKADIARHGAALGLDYAETYSCYKGGEHHCGTCGTCTERRQALREAGIPDHTIYNNS